VSTYSHIHRKIRDYQDDYSVVDGGDALRLMKLSEEVGEVMEAFIGYSGGNKRKGRNKSEMDIAHELTDVIITAMVALYDWVEDPQAYLDSKLNALRARVELEGS